MLRTQVQAFRELQGRHRLELGVSWHVTPRARHWLFFAFVNFRGAKGQGRVALQEVCTLADRWAIKLTLATTIPKLCPYYESFGFVRDPGYTGTAVFFYMRKPVHTSSTIVSSGDNMAREPAPC